MTTPTQDPNVLAWALGIISTVVVTLLAYFSRDRQARNKQTDDNTRRIIKLETTKVNEDRVRELLSEGLLPIMTGITNIEKMLLENTQKVAALDQRYEINKAVIEERERLLKEIEDRKT
jgi:hypothetical protein